ncbi:MAG: PIN domain-containing protein [Bacteroidia bacterium]|nr:PIN domain-containing protein [Bacteroidia bacterium]
MSIVPTQRVVLDACVLYPAPLRDFLLSLASEKLFTPIWSQEINQEWIRNLLEKRPDLLEKNLQLTVAAMNKAFPEALVTDFGHLIPEISLPDPDDRHVLACAIKAGANSIITFNTRDFPKDNTDQFTLKVLHPDDYLVELVGSNREEACLGFRKMVKRLRNPPISEEKVLETLIKCGLPKTAKKIQENCNSESEEEITEIKG